MAFSTITNVIYSRFRNSLIVPGLKNGQSIEWRQSKAVSVIDSTNFCEDIMLRSVSTDFQNGEAMSLAGGAHIESKLLTELDEFAGLHELGYHRITKGFQYTPHKHVGWIIACILQGRMEVKTVGHDEIEVFGPGDTYFVEPGTVHTETALEDTLVLVVINQADPGREEYGIAAYPARSV